MNKEKIIRYFPEKLQRILEATDLSKLEEIRLRAGKRCALGIDGNNILLDCTASQAELEQTMQIISRASVYAYIEEIKNCFVTVEGGHRAGLCGRAVISGGEIINLIQISGINLRLARQVVGCADGVVRHVIGGRLKNTLIISPPQCGKTTILRDLARTLGGSRRVSVIDERGEIAAMHAGVPQLDVGEMTDVLDLCPKSVGIGLMLRSMSPEVVVTDEISSGDIAAITQALSCGVKVIATAHGDNFEQVRQRLKLGDVAGEFECIVLLSRKNGAGTIESVLKADKA